MHALTQQYQKEKSKYEVCSQKVELLTKELLASQNVKFHKLEARVKSIDSFDKKIINKNNKYNNISEITDIIGIRIITYFEDEVDIVANVIEKEFEIDIKNSKDKRILPISTFGYRSLHYVASINSSRKDLIEYTRFKDIKFEIQIRSILQHAWAEIEHDLGYKGLNTVPDSFKRNFSMIAALLEMADRDFVTLRNQSDEYKVNIGSVIKNKPESVDINIDSLAVFINKNEQICKIDNLIAENAQTSLSDLNEVDYLVDILKYFDIITIDNLSKKLQDNESLIIKFANNWLGKRSDRSVLMKGISILYLGYILIGSKEENYITDYLTSLRIYNNNDSTSKKIKKTYNALVK